MMKKTVEVRIPVKDRKDQIPKPDDGIRWIGPRYEYEYHHPPDWQCLIAGVIGSTLAFLIVLLIVRGMSRGIKYLSLWIIDGFKEEKKAKK